MTSTMWFDQALSFALTTSAWWLTLVIGLGMTAIVIGVIDAVRRRTSPRKVHPAWLVIVRVLSGGFVTLVALQPQWTEENVTTTQGHVAVLVDRSRSMGVATREGLTRQAQAMELVQRWSRESLPMRLFGFGDKVTTLNVADLVNDANLQDGTAIGRAVEHVAQSFGADLGAIVVVSDGHETGPSLDANRLRALNVKVHTVVAASGAALEDDAIVDVQVPPLAVLRESAQLRVVVRAPQRAGQTIPVTLKHDDEVLVDGLVTIDGAGKGETTLTLVPTRLGRQLLRVEIPVASQDPLPFNNARTVLLRVVRERTRVLLVSGRPGWDARFLRGLLNADPAVDLITFFILRTANDLPMASPEEMSLIPFPTDELFREHLDSFDVVLFQDFEYGPYEMARYLPGIADYVRRGGSFAMIGGGQSFGAGGYARTPIADILPVELDGGYDVLEGAFRPVIDSGAGEHPIIRLAPEEGVNRALWGKATQMLGTQRFLHARLGAQTLLSHPIARTTAGAALPVLVVGAASEGRVLALGVDTSWRWGMANAANSGDASLYERFWSRALRWLTRDPLLEPSTLETDQERYAPGAPIKVTGQLRDKTYAPHGELGVYIDVLEEHGAVLATMGVTTDHEGRVEATLEAPGAGGYRVVARTERDEVLAENVIVVEAGGPELSDVTAQPETLATLSAQTGGAHVASIDKAPALAEFDRGRSRVAGAVVHAPFKSIGFIVLTVLVLAAEWFLRRRAGLK